MPTSAAALTAAVIGRNGVRLLARSRATTFTSSPVVTMLPRRPRPPPPVRPGAPFRRGAALLAAAAPTYDGGRDYERAGAVPVGYTTSTTRRPSGCCLRRLSSSSSPPTSASEGLRGRAAAADGTARPLHLRPEGGPGGDTEDGVQLQVPPPPTWSVAELRLSSPDGTSDGGTATSAASAVEAEVTDQDLRVLAGRCLIDVPDDPSELSSLRRGVGEMMRCLSVVTETGGGGPAGSPDLTDDIGPEEMYDLPRGVKAPVRGDDHVCSSVEESRRVLGAVRHKQVEVGGQLYFTTPAPGIPAAAATSAAASAATAFDSSNSDEID